MPKGSRGGQRASSGPKTVTRVRKTSAGAGGSPASSVATTPAPQPAPQPASQPAAQPAPAQVAQGNIMPAGGVAFSTFETLTDDKKADVIKDALKSGTPMFLDNSGLQKFAYFTGMSDKPQLVTEAAINATPGRDLWRSVSHAYKSSADIGYSSKDIYNQIVKGDFTNYSDSGGSAYGKAIYFDIHKGSYGIGGKHTVMHAKLAPGAKTISDGQLSAMYSRALSRGDKLAVACSKADASSRVNLYGLAKGYDAKISPGGYHMVFNRRCLLISDKTF